ncbi:MAG: metabolite traffic protein EboE [Daejeonella sp.]
MKLASGHLSYCTNIHAGESWKDHFESLKHNFPLIKAQVAPGHAMGIGLRLSNAASIDLQNDRNLEAFKLWLRENDAYVFTMNGFPFGDFHHAVVKDQVHTPDWTTNERLEYTLRLFDILIELLPYGMSGGISTSPLSYRHWFSTDELIKQAERIATVNIISIIERLFRIKKETQVSMHLDIEPEPDGLLETGAEFIHWFEHILLPMAEAQLPGRLNISVQEAGECVREHICLCYDVCHFAIGYEPHQDILKELAEKGIRVGKIQISAALKADLPRDNALRDRVAEEFSKFNETTYLHQVVARKQNNELLRYRDLPEALSDINNPLAHEWRAHFHVPVFCKDLGLLKSTQSDIIEVLQLQKGNAFTSQMEIETYTWEVLPEALKVPIALSISRELNWVKGILDS